MPATPETTATEPTTAPVRPGAFWLVGLVVLTFLAAASAPTPLYVVLQREWGFSALTLTTVQLFWNRE